MKRFTSLIAMAMLLTLAVTFAHATAEKLTGTIESRKDAVSSRGNPYVRFIVQMERELDGIKYDDSGAVMAFGKQVPTVAHLKAGDTIKAIVTSRIYNGRTSWTIKKLLE